MTLDAVLAKIDDNLDDATERLLDLLRIPSVSTDPAYADDCVKAADWLVEDLKTIGFDAARYDTTGHPMVVAHIKGGDPSAPHVLFYGHYDVQPVDPIELWDSPPFEPALEKTDKGVVIRGRGSSDDKGQLMTFVEACRAWIEVHGTLPINITLFFEGEEESGSPSLVPFMQKHAEQLKADIALICDTGLFQSTVPNIVTQLRGMLTEEITITGASRDLHSGMYGGLAGNPIHVLSNIIAGLRDDQGHITLPGFYDDVPELSDEMRRQWQGLAFDHAAFLGDVGLSQPAGESERTPLEMLWSRPTCEVNGIWGGYIGDGFKTVLPAQAHAKISFRLVGKQDPDKIHAALVDYINAALPADFSAEFAPARGTAATQISADNPTFEKSLQALSGEWGHPGAYIGCGGSIPVGGHFKDVLGMEAMFIGFARDDDAIHSPNEKYDLECFHKGTRSWARIMAALAG
ncbi:MAG: hypothetical protein CSA68_04445 [Rhodobacterales bacterium]|nr:MAG: hypothetical protein CSA68_04445 [Rhodobacterales bacterium]